VPLPVALARIHYPFACFCLHFFLSCPSSMPTSTTDTPSSSLPSLDKENNVSIDPSKLSLKDRIKYFSEKNKSNGSAPIRGAGAAAAAITLAAAASLSTSTATSAAAVVMDLNSSMTSSSRTHALAAKLENKLPLFHPNHHQSATAAAASTSMAAGHSHQCISFFAPLTGELGIRLHQAAKDAPIKVEAVDSVGVAALAGVRIGDVLIRAPYSLDGAPADVEDAAREYLHGARGGVALEFQR
jgi:hypothetical protein